MGWAAPLLLPGPPLQLELLLPLQGLAGRQALCCRQVQQLALLELVLRPAGHSAVPAMPGPAGGLMPAFHCPALGRLPLDCRCCAWELAGLCTPRPACVVAVGDADRPGLLRISANAPPSALCRRRPVLRPGGSGPGGGPARPLRAAGGAGQPPAAGARQPCARGAAQAAAAQLPAQDGPVCGEAGAGGWACCSSAAAAALPIQGCWALRLVPACADICRALCLACLTFRHLPHLMPHLMPPACCLQLEQVNELLLLGDPILLAPADDLADYDAAPAGAAAGAPRASSSQEALEGNALLQAGLAEELAASGRGLLASGFQDAAQRCSRAFRWALEQHVLAFLHACMHALPACLPACLVCPV